MVPTRGTPSSTSRLGTCPVASSATGSAPPPTPAPGYSEQRCRPMPSCEQALYKVSTTAYTCTRVTASSAAGPCPVASSATRPAPTTTTYTCTTGTASGAANRPAGWHASFPCSGRPRRAADRAGQVPRGTFHGASLVISASKQQQLVFLMGEHDPKPLTSEPGARSPEPGARSPGPGAQTAGDATSNPLGGNSPRSASSRLVSPRLARRSLVRREGGVPRHSVPGTRRKQSALVDGVTRVEPAPWRQ